MIIFPPADAFILLWHCHYRHNCIFKPPRDAPLLQNPSTRHNTLPLGPGRGFLTRLGITLPDWIKHWTPPFSSPSSSPSSIAGEGKRATQFSPLHSLGRLEEPWCQQQSLTWPGSPASSVLSSVKPYRWCRMQQPVRSSVSPKGHVIYTGYQWPGSNSITTASFPLNFAGVDFSNVSKPANKRHLSPFCSDPTHTQTTAVGWRVSYQSPYKAKDVHQVSSVVWGSDPPCQLWSCLIANFEAQGRRGLSV